MRRSTHALPIAGSLWLSRPPFLMLARVTALDASRSPALVRYELYDDAGSLLCGPVSEPLTRRWWTDFQPLVRREG